MQWNSNILSGVYHSKLWFVCYDFKQINCFNAIFLIIKEETFYLQKNNNNNTLKHVTFTNIQNH